MLLWWNQGGERRGRVATLRNSRSWKGGMHASKCVLSLSLDRSGVMIAVVMLKSSILLPSTLTPSTFSPSCTHQFFFAAAESTELSLARLIPAPCNVSPERMDKSINQSIQNQNILTYLSAFCPSTEEQISSSPTLFLSTIV